MPYPSEAGMKLGKMLSVGEVVEHPAAEEPLVAELPAEAAPVTVATPEPASALADRAPAPTPAVARATR
jgi:hypothetical protein